MAFITQEHSLNRSVQTWFLQETSAEKFKGKEKRGETHRNFNRFSYPLREKLLTVGIKYSSVVSHFKMFCPLPEFYSKEWKVAE